ncbi:MAG: hypothetical protein AAF495_04695 [Pseudomonadota bacterium]
MLQPRLAAPFLGLLVLALPSPVAAHAFGARYDLPIPLSLYLIGAGAAVLLSFVVTAVFLRSVEAAQAKYTADLKNTPLGWLVGFRPLHTLLRVVSVGIFCLIIATGYFGVEHSLKNLAPTMVWVIFWVGMAFVSALIGNLWGLVNPWKILFAWAERLTGGLTLNKPYPERLGVWPAIILFLTISWIELVYETPGKPSFIASIILVYSAITWGAMVVFGAETWLKRGEVFTVFFTLFARFALFAVEDGRLKIRPFGIGLLDDKPVTRSMMAFVILALSTVTFDGISETETWANFLTWIGESPALRDTLLALRSVAVNLIALIISASIVLLPLSFLAIYLIFSLFMAKAAGGRLPAGEVARFFVLTLVPIAIAYHVAHYLSFLMLAGQLIVPLSSDPFGYGWDLFGGAAYRMDISVVSAKMVWYVAVAAIVVGHVIAVYLAHVMALRAFKDHRAALLSQIPMVILMVGYTMISLWILSQPIVE